MASTKQTRRVEPAYHNLEFLDSDEGRPIRILAEYLEPLYKLHHEGIQDTIVFFGSARMTEDGPNARYYKDARNLAYKLTKWSLSLEEPKRFVVCSGGGGGIMEAANRGAREAGGPTIGFNIGLPHEQRPNSYITESLCFEFHYFFMRKLWFSHLARALIVFPGGFGTVDELAEQLTLAQTGKIDRSVQILLYGTEYWDQVINFDAMVKHGMIDASDMNLIHRVNDVETAFDFLTSHLPTEEKAICPSIAKARFSGRLNKGG